MTIIHPSQKILDIYIHSNELQKLIFIEVLEDLVKPLEDKQEITLNPQMIMMEDFINDFEKELQTVPPEILIDTFNKIIQSFPKCEEGEVMVPFSNNKARIHFGKKLRDELVSIGDEEVDEIHAYRKIFILNLEKKGIIKKCPIIKDSFLDNMIRDYKNEVTLKNHNGEIIGINHDVFDSSLQKGLSTAYEIFGENKIQEAMIQFLELDITIIALKIDDIIKSLELITGKKQQSEMTKYNHESGILSYKGESFHFKKGLPPAILLNIIFREENEISLSLAHRFLSQEYPLDKNDFYKGGKEVTESIIKGINRRIRQKFPKESFLEISNSHILRRK